MSSPNSLRSVQQAGVAYYVELLPRVVARGVRAIGRDARVVARGSVLIAAQPSGTASSLTSLCVGWARRTPCFWGSATVGMGNGLAAVGPEMLWYTGACFAGPPYADCSGGDRSVDVSFMECNLSCSAGLQALAAWEATWDDGPGRSVICHMHVDIECLGW